MSPARRAREGTPRRYPRSARVNEILREVLGDALERLVDSDERLTMVTVTAVQCDPDLRRATVLLSSMTAEAKEALDDLRVRLQAEISSQVRMKRTPQLTFEADPAVAAGQRIEDILLRIGPLPTSPEETAAPDDSAPGAGPTPGPNAASPSTSTAGRIPASPAP